MCPEPQYIDIGELGGHSRLRALIVTIQFNDYFQDLFRKS